MRSWERLPFTQWADIQRTERFICVEPRSGYSMILPENDGYTIHLPHDASDEALGRALLEALDRSRFIWPADEPEFFEWQRYVKCDRHWEKETMRRYSYKTRRDLYKNMNWCRAERSEGKLSIKPHRRDQPGLWTDVPPEKIVVVPASQNVATLGAALRLALSRCE